MQTDYLCPFRYLCPFFSFEHRGPFGPPVREGAGRAHGDDDGGRGGVSRSGDTAGRGGASVAPPRQPLRLSRRTGERAIGAIRIASPAATQSQSRGVELTTRKAIAGTTFTIALFVVLSSFPIIAPSTPLLLCTTRVFEYFCAVIHPAQFFSLTVENRQSHTRKQKEIQLQR